MRSSAFPIMIECKPSCCPGCGGDYLYFYAVRTPRTILPLKNVTIKLCVGEACKDEFDHQAAIGGSGLREKMIRAAQFLYKQYAQPMEEAQ